MFMVMAMNALQGWQQFQPWVSAALPPVMRPGRSLTAYGRYAWG